MRNKKILDSKRLISNLMQYKPKRICAMVKSNAYGHGLEEIVKIAQDTVDYFGVVSLQEAQRVRSVTQKPILLCSKVDDFAKCKALDVDIIIDDKSDLQQAIEHKNKIHLKLNCGMNRFGVKCIEELKEINDLIERNNVKLLSVCTHFSNLENRNKTIKEYARFCELRSLIKQEVPNCFGGSRVSRYPFKFDIIRVGIGMYGYGKNSLPVEKIVSYVSKIFIAKKGETIGYGGTYKAKQDAIFAVVPVGYGDGLRRCLGGKFYVKIGNQFYKSVGRICMDAFFILVDGAVKVGDEVVVMENAEDLAHGTIAYEVLTGFSNFRGETIIE